MFAYLEENYVKLIGSAVLCLQGCSVITRRRKELPQGKKGWIISGLSEIFNFIGAFSVIHLVASVSFVIAFLPKVTLNIARPMYCLSFVLHCVHFMKVLVVFENIGPMIYMIRKMVSLQ